MSNRLLSLSPIAIIVCVLLSVRPLMAADRPADTDAGVGADQLLEAAGVSGGLIVHIGCGDGELTAALHAGPSYLVQGLDAEPADVKAARRRVRAAGRYGEVCVDALRGQRLPYVDNLVNLLVVTDAPDAVSGDEIRRVLCPNGVALIAPAAARAADISGEKVDIGDEKWTKVVSPRPSEIDEWTHYLHDATGNAVSEDERVGPPEHLQWTAGPKWSRHHNHISSTNGMVSSGGRIFYIFDEGPTSAIQLPPNWKLIARDAFNGKVLWKREIDKWHTHLWRLKCGPAQLPRRLVAVGDTVFATLGITAPVTALDAATGETKRTYDGTTATREILFSDGVLFLLVNDEPADRPWGTEPPPKSVGEFRREPTNWKWNAPDRVIMAIDADSGELLWKKGSVVAPLTLAVGNARVLFHDGERVMCLDRDSGDKLWASEPIPRAEPMRPWFGPSLVIEDDVVMFAGGENIVWHRGGRDSMTALDGDTGKVLWSAEHPPSAYDAPEDLFVINDRVWTAPTTNRRDTGIFMGRDLRTGKVERHFLPDDGDHMPHHRCHSARATTNYVLTSRTGIEYVDMDAEHWNRHDWIRGACLYGIMPANGLTYAPPHSCACYVTAKLSGFNAVAADREVTCESAGSSRPQRLERGPAFGELQSFDRQSASTDQWRTYRHDPARSGATDMAIKPDVKSLWQAELKGDLTPPVIGDDRVFIAEVDRHTLHSFDADSGTRQWSHTVGGRIDSPPTVWRGRVIFGSADGHIYCLRATDGAVVWRFRAAPCNLRLTSYQQLESVWPVHGSVLVINGEVHAVAGRSMFPDGGLRYIRLNATTGELIYENVMDDINPETGKALDADIEWSNLPVALPDILSSDGERVYMRSQKFNLAGTRTSIDIPTRDQFDDQTGPGAHLYSRTGFLDDSWWHRTFWVWGKHPGSAAGWWFASGYNAPAGRILAFDKTHVYGFGRRPRHFPGTTRLEYHLFGVKKTAKRKKLREPRRSWRPTPRRLEYDWSVQPDLLGRALVMTKDTLFVAGPPDVVDTYKSVSNYVDPETQDALRAQCEANAGKRGGILRAVDLNDGSKLEQIKLDAVPVFDGMAAANGRLYMATIDGRLLCLGPS